MGVKATCQSSRSPEAPAHVTYGLEHVGLSEVFGGRLPSGDPAVERPASSCEAAERHGAWRRRPIRREGPYGVRFFVKDCRRIIPLGSDEVVVAFLLPCCLAVGRWPCLGSGLLMLNATGRYVVFRSEGSTLVVATLWRQVLAVRTCLGWPMALLGVSGRGAVVACAARLVLVISQLCRFCGGRPASSPFAQCLALEGLSHSEVVSISWDPVLVSLLRVAPGYERARVGSPRERTLELREKRAAEAGARLASIACGLRVPLLATSGGGLVVVVVTAFPYDVSKFYNGTGVYGFPTWWCVHGPRWFYLWALDPVELQLLLCRVRGDCDRSVFVPWWRVAVDSLAVDFPLRELACGVAFTSAWLLPVEPVEGVPTLLAFPLLKGRVLCYVCRVASLVERCDTCLWLLSAWCWLVVSSGEVLPEFFSVGSGRSENRCYCPGEGFSQDCFALNDALVVLVEVLLGLACIVSAVPLAAVFSLMVRIIGLCILVKVLPRIALCRFWWRTALGAFGGVCSVEVLYAWPCVWLLSWPAYLVVYFQVFSAVLVVLRVSLWSVWSASFLVPGVLSQMVVWVVVVTTEKSCGRLPSGDPAVEQPASSYGAAERRGARRRRPIRREGPYGVRFFVKMDACRWCSVYVFKFCAWWVWARRGGVVLLEPSFTCFRGMLLSPFHLVVVCQEATCSLSLSGGDRLAFAFASVVQFQFPIVAVVGSCPSWLREASPSCHEAYPSCWALVVWPFGVWALGDEVLVAFLLMCCLAAGWWSCLGSDLLMLNVTGRYVAFRSEGGTLVVLAIRACLGWPTALLEVFERGAVCACAAGLRLSSFPGTLVLVSLLRVASGYERARVGSPREQTLELRGKRGAEAGARLASRAYGLRVPLLAASGGGLVAVVVTTFPYDVSKCYLLP
ncbi:hypothetical protein Taro_040712 [Colocasia esculenta]|uniref:Uncharacterized protein n=1 Tax=Colocasia esculenta TaxID=4460 RepID=A0A843WJQ0_COLES|nr:hypothetical protein [Colocasia esculenta]